MVVSSCEPAFKAFERIPHTRETTMIVISRIIPDAWSVLQSHGPQDPNQSKSNKSKKDPVERVTFLSKVAYSAILCN